MPSSTPRKPEKPTLWIVAGPNGSGKSSLYNRTDIEGWGGSVWIINPDLLTQSIIEQEGLALGAANLEAVQRLERWLYASIDVYQTIGVETVLSTDKYRQLVLRATRAGYRVRMIYVVLESTELQLERIRMRVGEGGHDVPTEKVAARRLRSFEQIGWFIQNVDDCYIYDNSTGEPQLIAVSLGDTLIVLNELPSDLREALEASGVGLFPPETT